MASNKKRKLSTEKDHEDSDIVKLTLSNELIQDFTNLPRKISTTQFASLPTKSIEHNNCAKNEATKASVDRGGDNEILCEPSNFLSKKDGKESNECNELFIRSSENIAYSWDSLKLGEGNGSAALRDFVKKDVTADELNSDTFEEESALTARTILDMISTLRPKTCLPPPDSKLHQVVQKVQYSDVTQFFLPNDA